MRALIQRVARAQVAENGPSTEKLANIGRGLVLLVGFEEADTVVSIEQMIQKIKNLRVFPDGDGKMNLAGGEVGAQYLIVSQFTLYAELKYGNRPSFTRASPKEKARETYDLFIRTATRMMGQEQVRHSPFGADLAVELVNDGPVTIWMDSMDIL